MNNDIVPSLLEEIQKQFDEEIKANEKIKSILIRQKQGAVDYTDSLSFAKELGVSLKTNKSFCFKYGRINSRKTINNL